MTHCTNIAVKFLKAPGDELKVSMNPNLFLVSPSALTPTLISDFRLNYQTILGVAQ